MKKIILSCVALLATFFCASTVSAQGVKIYKVGGEVIDIPAAQLDYIEAYDATTTAPAFEGTWKMKQLITTAEVMTANNYNMVTFGDAFPKFEAEDELTFKDGKIIPNLKSNLKNFFIGEATYEIVDEAYVIHPTATTGVAVTLTELKVKGVNRNFDANSKSEDDEAFIGVRLVEDEDADEPGIYYLEVYLFDYKSTSFALEWNDFFMYTDTKPQAAYSDMPIYFSMEKKGATSRKNAPAQTYIVNSESTMTDLKTNNYAIAFLGASWSGPCKISIPIMDSLVATSNQSIGYGTVEESTLTQSLFTNYRIESYPTIILFHGGNEYDRIEGIPVGEKAQRIQNFINNANTLPY